MRLFSLQSLFLWTIYLFYCSFSLYHMYVYPHVINFDPQQLVLSGGFLKGHSGKHESLTEVKTTQTALT